MAAALLASVLLSAQRPRLPFNIQSSQLAQVRITLRAASTKPKSGQDEIIITGDGKVTLRTVPFANAGPKELTGKVAPSAVERLLELLKNEGIEGWDDEYKAQSRDYASKALTIEVGEAIQKQVVMARAEFPEFAHAIGAVKLLAAQACPEALNGRFFQRF